MPVQLLRAHPEPLGLVDGVKNQTCRQIQFLSGFESLLGVYGGMNENFVLVAGRSRWQADGV
jgi:hypothetical protein